MNAKGADSATDYLAVPSSLPKDPELPVSPKKDNAELKRKSLKAKEDDKSKADEKMADSAKRKSFFDKIFGNSDGKKAAGVGKTEIKVDIEVLQVPGSEMLRVRTSVHSVRLHVHAVIGPTEDPARRCCVRAD